MSSNPFDSAEAAAELSALYELSFLRYSDSLAGFTSEALEKALRLFGIRRFALWVGPPDARSIYLMSGLRDEQSALSLARENAPNLFVEALGVNGTLGLLLMEQASAIAPKERRLYNIYARRVEDGLAAKGEQERQETFRALTSSEERYRMLFEQSMDAVCINAPDGASIDANQAWLDLFGYSRDELTGFNAVVLYANQEDREDFLHRIDRTGHVRDEVRYKKKDGTVLNCVRSVVAWKDKNGNTVAHHGVTHDITEQKRAQEELRSSEERYRSLFEQIGDAININAPDGTLLQVNPAFHDLFGYTREDISSFNVVDVYADPADREYFLRRMAKTGFVKDEVRFRRKDGSVFDCQRTAVARKGESGAVIAYLGINRDITERKRMAERLAEANRELRELTARLEAAREEERAEVAWELHDHIAQALSVLKVDVASCRSRLPEEAPASLAPTMDGMTHLLDETIGRLRRLYADLIPVMLEDLGPAATIEWQAEEFARRSGVECEVRRVENLTLPRGRVALGMFRVLQEALDNVRRHSGATRVTVDFTREGGQAVLRVADNGRGFTKHEMRKSGALGLVGIRERARSWGGRMTVNTSAGAGTVLKVTAPLEDEPAVRTEPESPDI